MGTCTSGSCNKEGTTNTTSTPSTDETRDIFFNILLPVILVVSVFIAIGLGLLFHRLILKLLKKRWASGSFGGSSGSVEGGSYTTRGISAISQSISDLPTYGQVMKTIEKEGKPPSYSEIAAGETNYSFSSQPELLAASSLPREREVAVNSGIARAELNLNHVSPLHAVSELDTSQSCSPINNEPPSDQSEMRSKTDLDDVINSISVPSILFEEEDSTSSKAKAPKKGTDSKMTKNKASHSKAAGSHTRGRSRSMFLRSTPL